MRYIAIIQTSETSGCYECGGSEVIANSITDWQEVSEDDFKLLLDASYKSQSYRSKLPRFQVIERPTDAPTFIARTIDEYKRLVEIETKKEEELKKKRAEQYAKKKAEDAAKKVERLKRQLEKLQAETSA